MDVKSPAAADPVSRPSSNPPPPVEPDRVARALRGAGIAAAGVGVAALTAAACVLSFEDLRAFAVAGEADQRLAYLYPAAFDALFAIAMISVLLLRGGRWPVRLQAGVILTLLLVAAAAVEVTTALRATVDVRQAAVVVAVAPWAMLALALWLWLLLIKHAATRRVAADAATASHGRDIVPFSDADMPTAEYPAHRGRPARPAAEPAQAVQTTAPATAHSAPAVQLSHAEVVLDPQAAPPLESAPHHDLPPGVPVVGPTAAPETPEVDELPERPAAPASSERRTTTEHPATPEAVPAPEPAPEHTPLREKPVRWGDLVRPSQEDLLVHPPRPAVQGGAVREGRPGPEGRVSERVETWDADTEPARKGAEPSQEDAAPARKGAESSREGTEPVRKGVQPSRGSTGPSRKRDRKRKGEIDDRDVDTQPIPTMSEQTTPEQMVSEQMVSEQMVSEQPPGGASPDPVHGAEAADHEESPARVTARPEPQAEQAGETDGGSGSNGEDTTPPPSMRVRSTPTPPEV
ncbi:hypothetical protein [Streptosporangium sp. NPDC087985]|uniref:hypothetical protein n=1 Tax=Streptosporangium sp. NPDC087985 TaxID=3366196 RepID=UPI003814334F